MSVTIKEISQLLDEKLETKLEEVLDRKLDEVLDRKLEEKLDDKLLPIYDKLDTISRDLSEIRRDLGYDNLRVIKGRQEEEM